MGVVVWGEVVVGELLAGVVGGEVVEGMVAVVGVVVGFLAGFRVRHLPYRAQMGCLHRGLVC